MADKAVLDTSAILAVLFEEPGRHVVIPHLIDGACSAVTVAEVATKLIEKGHAPGEAAATLGELTWSVHPLTGEDALAAGILRAATRKAGLSLGDRCCLALAQKLALPVLTADRAWAGIADAVGVEVRVIRP